MRACVRASVPAYVRVNTYTCLAKARFREDEGHQTKIIKGYRQTWYKNPCLGLSIQLQNVMAAFRSTLKN